MFSGREMIATALFVACVAMVCIGLEAAPIEIRVGAGTPNATLDAALEQVAAIRRKDTQTPIEVRIAPGDYAMDRQLMITKKHANTNWAELTVRADDFDRKPRLFGARDVKGWTKIRFNGRDDVWVADVSDLKLGKTSRLFFLDGRRMQPARWPNAVSGEPYGGCARALDDGIQMWQSPRFCNMGVYTDEIRFRPGEARSWSKPEYGWVIAWPRHNWWNAVYSIKSVSNDLVRLDAPHNEIRDRLFPWDRWRAENILEELDAPGEWYHDIGEHKLYFIPPEGIDPNAARPTVAHGEAVLSITGGNVAIEGLEILNGAGGLNISSADRVRVSGCSIHDIGFFRESAVRVRGHHVRIEDCDVFNTGGNGIFVESFGKECRVDDRMDVVIENNHVHHCGEVYSHGIGIWIGGQGVRVSHNLIHDMPRCGLFGYGRFNEISYNRIRQVNLVNDDTGAIYGSGWTDGVGTKVCYNHISHSIGYQRTRDGSYVTHSGAHGIYPDEGCGGLEIFGNLVDHCNGSGALLHNGRWITISNNVFVSNAPRAFAKGGGGQLSLSSWNNLTNDYFVSHRREAISKQYHGLVDKDPRWLSFPSIAQAPDKDSTAFNADGSTMMGVRVVNNIFYYPDQGKTDLLRGRRHFSIPDNPFDRNVYWSGNPTNITFKIGKGYEWKTWREAGQDADSVIADPMFVDPANGDYRLRLGSPALARGFKEIPYAEIGLRRTKFRRHFAAGAASNAYYRAECETVGGVTRLAGLVKVLKTGDVAVPGTWTVTGGADAVTFENGRIVVKGGLRFDAQGAAFTVTSRGVTFGEGSARYQIGLDGKRTAVTKVGFTLEPHPNTPGGVTWLDLTWQSVPPVLDPAQLAINRGHRIKFMHPLPRLRNGTVQCSVNNNPELAIPGVLTAQGKDIGFFMKSLRDVVSANRRLFFLEGKPVVCNHNWIRDHAHQMKGWCHWERDCLSFLQLIIDRQRSDGMYYELVKQLDDGHWMMVEDTSRILFPEDNLAMARLDLEADVEYLVVEAAHLYWRMTGDDAWMASVLPKLEKGINWQTSDPQRWNAAYGLCIRPFTIDTWDFVPMESTGQDRRIRPWEPMPAFHGDNTGVWQAMGQLAAMNERLGRADQAADWRRRADVLKANIFKHLWNGRFFIHQKFLGTDKGIDDKENERLSLSDAYALNRNILTLGQKRSIVEEYQRRRKTTGAFAEWFTIDPPYEPTFGSHKSGTYVNGAISPFTAGELAKGAFGCGYESYGWDILQRFMKMVEKDGAVYFLYNPKGGNSTTAYLGPSAWGAAALLSAVDEGLAGIVNTGFGYDEIAFSPRWPVTPYRELRYFTGYENVGRYVDYRYMQTDEGFRYNLRSPAKKIEAHLLVPTGKTPKTLRVNGAETPFALSAVGESRYVDAVAVPHDGTADFEVLY